MRLFPRDVSGEIESPGGKSSIHRLCSKGMTWADENNACELRACQDGGLIRRNGGLNMNVDRRGNADVREKRKPRGAEGCVAHPMKPVPRFSASITSSSSCFSGEKVTSVHNAPCLIDNSCMSSRAYNLVEEH